MNSAKVFKEAVHCGIMSVSMKTYITSEFECAKLGSSRYLKLPVLNRENTSILNSLNSILHDLTVLMSVSNGKPMAGLMFRPLVQVGN